MEVSQPSKVQEILANCKEASVEIFGGKVVTIPRPAHELLSNFWYRVSSAMQESQWLSRDQCQDLHVHQAS